MDENNRKYNHSLRRSIITVTALIVWLTCIIMDAISSVRYQVDSLELFQRYERDALNYMARLIDAEDLKKCIETGEKSEKYQILQKVADDLKETHSLQYLYIIKPLKAEPPDNMMDVLAACTDQEREETPDELTDLGRLTGDKYPQVVAAQYLKRMDTDPTVTFFRNDTDFGMIYTGIRPILDKDGKPIAVICADIPINDIYENSISNLLFSIGMAIIISSLMLVALYRWIEGRLLIPIDKLRSYVVEFEKRCRDHLDASELVIDAPDIDTKDELEALADTFTDMTEDVKSYASDLTHTKKRLSSMKDKMLTMDILAYRDGLTDAGNKAAYMKMSEGLDGDILLDEAEFSVVMIDLNYLKVVNDKYGHDKGDAYIKKMYEMISEVFVDSPLFRIGGDEFVVIAEGREHKNCKELVETLQARMEELSKDKSLSRWESISAAIGYSAFDPNTDISVEDVFKRADNLMYENKKAMHALRKD